MKKKYFHVYEINLIFAYEYDLKSEICEKAAMFITYKLTFYYFYSSKLAWIQLCS